MNKRRICHEDPVICESTALLQSTVDRVRLELSRLGNTGDPLEEMDNGTSSASPENNSKTASGHSFISKPRTTTMEKENSKAKRKISFLVDDKDKVIEDVYEYPFDPKVSHNDVWWTDDELDALLTDAMLVARHYTEKRKDWQTKIKFMLKMCQAKRDKHAAPTPLKAADLDFVVDSDSRGLEVYIHPIFEKNREKAIKGVVKVQSDYNANEKAKGVKDPELRLKVLKAQSMRLTQPARLLAKTLADGDARAAAAAWEQESGDDDDAQDPIPTEIMAATLPAKAENDKFNESTISFGSIDNDLSAHSNNSSRSPDLRLGGLEHMRRQHQQQGGKGIGSLSASLSQNH